MKCCGSLKPRLLQYLILNLDGFYGTFGTIQWRQVLTFVKHLKHKIEVHSTGQHTMGEIVNSITYMIQTTLSAKYHPTDITSTQKQADVKLGSNRHSATPATVVCLYLPPYVL